MHHAAFMKQHYGNDVSCNVVNMFLGHKKTKVKKYNSQKDFLMPSFLIHKKENSPAHLLQLIVWCNH